VLRTLTVFLPLLALAAIAGCVEATGAAKLGASQSVEGRICETVDAWATGFGEQKVADFAERNLNIVVLDTKDALRKKGAIGFSSNGRTVSCEPYIDFGPAIGREHECKARVTVCGRTR
jgi:hypothetical protein